MIYLDSPGEGEGAARKPLCIGVLLFLATFSFGGELARGGEIDVTAPKAVDSAGPVPEARMSEQSAVAEAGGLMWTVGDETGEAIWRIDPSSLAGTKTPLVLPDGVEVDDLEGLATGADGGLFAVCSQSLTKKGKRPIDSRGNPKRECLLSIRMEGAKALGSVAFGLRDALLAVLRVELGNEDVVARLDQTPASGGLNVEGLARWKDGLLIGLRSPLGAGGALVVALSNAPAMLASKASPQLGSLLTVPAAPGEGIRAMTQWEDSVLVLLGPSGDEDGRFRLVRWNPDSSEVVEHSVRGFTALPRPEGIVIHGDNLWVVQDLEADPGSPIVVLELDDAGSNSESGEDE